MKWQWLLKKHPEPTANKDHVVKILESNFGCSFYYNLVIVKSLGIFMSIMTRIEKIENKILNFKNEIISLSKIEGDLWDYHPDNPDMIDVKDSYQKIKDQIYDLELKIEEKEEELEYIKNEGDLSDQDWKGFDHKKPHKDK